MEQNIRSDKWEICKPGRPLAHGRTRTRLAVSGVGLPFGIAAALLNPQRLVVVATGDGAFGFNAIEVDTAVRHRAPVVIVVANNGAKPSALVEASTLAR